MSRRLIFKSSVSKKYFNKCRKKGGKTYQKIIELIQDIDRSPFDGLGKPEPLQHQFTGSWSRRINKKDRLIYQVTDQEIVILSCKGHYQ